MGAVPQRDISLTIEERITVALEEIVKNTRPPAPKLPLGNPVYFSPTELDAHAIELHKAARDGSGNISISKYIEENFVPKKLYDELGFRMDGLEK